jgi:hypothetical protein
MTTRARTIFGAGAGLFSYVAILLGVWWMTSSASEQADGSGGMAAVPLGVIHGVLATAPSALVSSMVVGIGVSATDERLRPSGSVVEGIIFWGLIAGILTWAGLVFYVVVSEEIIRGTGVAPAVAMLWGGCWYPLVALCMERLLSHRPRVEPPN